MLRYPSVVRRRLVESSLRIVAAALVIGTILCPATARAANMAVTAVHPPINGLAPLFAPVRITFDRPVLASTVNGANIRVFGRASGAPVGTFQISQGGTVVTFTPNRSWGAGETVQVNLGEGLMGQDGMPLRSSGYAWHFRVTCAPATISYQLIDTMSNRTTPGAQTRIYGAAACDFNNDGSVDLATVNEVSGDIRVFLNLDDGSGLYGDFLAPQAIGDEASPNDVGDFDNDGNADLVAAATNTNDIWVLLGDGDGTFSPVTGIDVGSDPHGIVAVDLDGDADQDIVVACAGSDNLSILVNNGAGAFAVQPSVDAGVDTEYGLAAGDMNRDGLIDLVVGGRDGQEVRTLLNNGDVTFTPAGASQATGGLVWVVTLGDLNGDGHLDVTTANSFTGNGARLLNLGAGTFGPAVVQALFSHTVSTDLGDLDGDGDLDWILSSFGSGFWRIFTNDGAGNFVVHSTIGASNNPSCAIILDFDNDHDLDLALTDEIADHIQLRKNIRVSSVPPPDAGRGRIQLAPNAPNPFHATTTIRFRLDEGGAMRLVLLDARGAARLTRDLGDGTPGWNEAVFEAIDDRGRPLAAGVYFYELSGIGDVARGKLTIHN